MRCYVRLSTTFVRVVGVITDIADHGTPKVRRRHDNGTMMVLRRFDEGTTKNALTRDKVAFMSDVGLVSCTTVVAQSSHTRGKPVSRLVQDLSTTLPTIIVPWYDLGMTLVPPLADCYQTVIGC